MGCELLRQFLSEQPAGGAGLGYLLEQAMGNAFKREIPDDELRRELDGTGVEPRALLDRATEYPPVQKDDRNISVLAELPPGLCVRRQQRKVTCHRARADRTPVERPLQLHVLAVVDAIG